MVFCLFSCGTPFYLPNSTFSWWDESQNRDKLIRKKSGAVFGQEECIGWASKFGFNSRYVCIFVLLWSEVMMSLLALASSCFTKSSPDWKDWMYVHNIYSFVCFMIYISLLYSLWCVQIISLFVRFWQFLPLMLYLFPEQDKPVKLKPLLNKES